MMWKSIVYIHLNTIDGVQRIPCEYIIEEQADNNILITINTEIDNKQIHVEGFDTEEAIIKFANQLPKGYKLQACISCKHGNFCPFGDNDNEIFCLSDISPRDKNDVFSVLVNSNEQINRRKTLFHYCSNFSPQNSEYYTYNSFCR